MVLVLDVGVRLEWWPLYHMGTEIRPGDQPPWGSEVPLMYLSTEGSSSGGSLCAAPHCPRGARLAVGRLVSGPCHTPAGEGLRC